MNRSAGLRPGSFRFMVPWRGFLRPWELPMNPKLVERNNPPRPSPQFAPLTPQIAQREKWWPRFGEVAMPDLSSFRDLMREFLWGNLAPSEQDLHPIPQPEGSFGPGRSALLRREFISAKWTFVQMHSDANQPHWQGPACTGTLPLIS